MHKPSREQKIPDLPLASPNPRKSKEHNAICSIPKLLFDPILHHGSVHRLAKSLAPALRAQRNLIPARSRKFDIVDVGSRLIVETSVPLVSSKKQMKMNKRKRSWQRLLSQPASLSDIPQLLRERTSKVFGIVHARQRVLVVT